MKKNVLVLTDDQLNELFCMCEYVDYRMTDYYEANRRCGRVRSDDWAYEGLENRVGEVTERIRKYVEEYTR